MSERQTTRRRWMRGVATFVAPVGLAPFTLGPFALGPLVRSARAHPVRIGRYTEIPYGVRRDHPMPTEGAGPGRTGRLAGAIGAVEPERTWEATLRARRARGPTIASDGALYLSSMGGVHRLSPHGTERWFAPVGAVHSAPSLTPSGDLVVLSRAGEVIRLRPGGHVVRRVDLGAPGRGAPLVLDDGSVLVATIDRRVHRVDANLRPMFTVELSDGTAGALARASAGHFAVCAGRTLTLLTARGRTVREVGLGGRATSAPAVADDGTLYVATAEGTLIQLDARGRVRARLELGSRHFGGANVAIAADGTVRVPTVTGGMLCVAGRGRERWRFANPQGFTGPASVGTSGGTLAVDRSGRMIAIDAQGTERWRVVLGHPSFSAPVMGADGTIYIALERGEVQAWSGRADTAQVGSAQVGSAQVGSAETRRGVRVPDQDRGARGM